MQCKIMLLIIMMYTVAAVLEGLATSQISVHTEQNLYLKITSLAAL